MNFINPQDCGCECVPVEVTCEIVGSDFNYTVENALTAELRRYETPYDIETDTPDEVVSVSLTNGSASGTWAISDASDTYCIYAENACSSETCCKECEVPYCTAELVTDDPALGSYDYGVRWTVGKRFASDSRLDTVEFDGNTTNIVGDPMSESGIGLYNFGDSSVSNEICVQVTNACGHTATCCIQIPCCYRVSAIVFDSANFADILQSCAYEPQEDIYPFANNTGAIELRTEINGLSNLNGTQVISLTPNGTCPTGLYPTGVMGSILDRWKVTRRQHTFPSGTNNPEDSCGNNIADTVSIWFENNWSGEYWWSWHENGTLRLLFIPTSGTRIEQRYRDCITDPYPSCVAGSPWSGDAGWCIIDHVQDPAILTSGTFEIANSGPGIPDSVRLSADCFTAPSTRGLVVVDVAHISIACYPGRQPTNFGTDGYAATTPCPCTGWQNGETKIYFQ